MVQQNSLHHEATGRDTFLGVGVFTFFKHHWYNSDVNYFSFGHYFLIFLIIAASAYAAMPFVQNTFRDISDTYVRSQMQRVQSEVLFLSARNHNFRHVCFEGIIHETLKDIIQGHSKYTSCRSNIPEYSELIICSYLKSGRYLCVDGIGISCEITFEPSGYQCRNIFWRVLIFLRNPIGWRVLQTHLIILS